MVRIRPFLIIASKPTNVCQDVRKNAAKANPRAT